MVSKKRKFLSYKILKPDVKRTNRKHACRSHCRRKKNKYPVRVLAQEHYFQPEEVHQDWDHERSR